MQGIPFMPIDTCGPRYQFSEILFPLNLLGNTFWNTEVQILCVWNLVLSSSLGEVLKHFVVLYCQQI